MVTRRNNVFGCAANFLRGKKCVWCGSYKVTRTARGYVKCRLCQLSYELPFYLRLRYSLYCATPPIPTMIVFESLFCRHCLPKRRCDEQTPTHDFNGGKLFTSSKKPHRCMEKAVRHGCQPAYSSKRWSTVKDGRTMFEEENRYIYMPDLSLVA